MNLYRVTGFDGQNNKEYNVGLFLADNREEAIRKAQTLEPDQTKTLVLDAALQASTLPRKS
jgi:hypothetical protein